MLHAIPFLPGIPGFDFDSEDDFNTKSEAHHEKYGVEQTEYAIENHDEDRLSKLCNVNPKTLERWFDEIEPLQQDLKAALFYLLDMTGMDVGEALEKIQDVSLYEGTAEDAAIELFNDLYLHEIPSKLQNYINYAAFQCDLECNSELVEFSFEGQTYACTNASSL